VSDQLHTSVKETDVLSTGGWLSKELAWAFEVRKENLRPCRESNPVPFSTWRSHYTDISVYKSRRAPVSTDSVFAIPVIRGLTRPEKFGKLKK
jgi:hypothetical protein